MVNIEVRLTIVQNSGDKLHNAYMLSWDSNKKTFETLIMDLLNTIQVTEDPGTLQSIVLNDIIVKDATYSEREEIDNFKKEAGIA